VRFHQTDGAAYEFIADKVLELDRLNPQVAASLVASFNQWKRYDSARQDLMKAQLERIAGTAGLSKDVGEIVARSLSN
jgi:aminopeptidase N